MRILIAQTQIANSAHAKLDVKFQNRKETQESSYMRLLNVMFSDDFPPEVVTTNNANTKVELDKGNAGRSQRLWSSISEAYNYAENDGLYSQFSFVEDEEVAGIAIKHDLSRFHRLDWTKVTSWFKNIVKSYHEEKVRYTTSGEHDPTFFAYTRGKPQLYYYRLHLMAKPNSHLAFGVVLDSALFFESSESTTRKPGDRIANRGSLTLKKNIL